MNNTETEQQGDPDAFRRSDLDIPLDHELREKSFVELAALLSSCENGSAKFNVVERELKKHLAKDQSEINRPNMLWAAGIGGVFALSGVVLGAYLNNPPACKNIAPAGAVQQVENSNLAEKPPVWNITPSAPSVADPAVKPVPVQNNAQPSK